MATRSKKGGKWPRGRQVVGKAPSGWEGDIYPEGAVTKRPSRLKRKSSGQDRAGQPIVPRMAERVSIIQEANQLRGGR